MVGTYISVCNNIQRFYDLIKGLHENQEQKIIKDIIKDIYSFIETNMYFEHYSYLENISKIIEIDELRGQKLLRWAEVSMVLHNFNINK